MTNAVKRDANIELLRILLMGMIIGLHVLFFGGSFLWLPKSGTLFTAYFLESLFSPAVNCFILISGYFGVTSFFRKQKFIGLWGTAIFYSVLFSALYFALSGNPLRLSDIARAFAPVITKRWWFLGCYLAMYLLSDFLNKLLLTLNKNEFRRLVTIGFFMFVALSTLSEFFSPITPLVDSGGYSLLYFLYLYTVGAYMRLHVKRLWRPALCAALFLASIFCSFALSSLFYSLSDKFDNAAPFWHYDSAPVFFAAVFLLAFFKQLSVTWQGFAVLSPLVFPVYLIHEHIHLRAFIYEALGWNRAYFGLEFLARYFLSIIIIYISCLAVEFARSRLLAPVTKRIFARPKEEAL